MPSNPELSKRPTLKDVADRAGVSVMCASLAVREAEDSRRIASATRLRVMEVARELGYRPDARARALRLSQTNVIGFYAGYGWTDVRMPFFAEIIGGLQQGCELLKKNLLLHSATRGGATEEIYRELVDGTVDGIVVAMPADNELVVRLAEDHLPVVAVADAIPNIPSVVVDDLGGAEMIARHLADLGHRSVVFATSAVLPYSGKRRQQSFVESAVSLGIDVMVRAIVGEAELGDFVLSARKSGASVIVAWNDVDARRILKASRVAGLNVPRDMAIVGFDGCPVPYEDPFPLTTIRAPWAEVAQEAVLQLGRMAHKESCPMVTTMPVEFIRGATT